MTNAQDSENALNDNSVAALCYVLTVITGVIFLLLSPYNKNSSIRFHAFQAIFLGAGMMLTDMVLKFIIVGLHFYALSFILSLTNLGFFVLWLYMIFMSYQGKTIVLPVIGELAQQQSKK